MWAEIPPLPSPYSPHSQELAWAHGRRLPEESFLLPRRDRDLGILYMGAQERMRLVVHRMIKGRGRQGQLGIGMGSRYLAGWGIPPEVLRHPSCLGIPHPSFLTISHDWVILLGHPAGIRTRLAAVVSRAGRCSF